MNARDHIRTAHSFLDFGNDEGPQPSLAIAHALLSIACTLADMADMDADTRTQPAVKPPAPPPDYQLNIPIDNHDGTYRQVSGTVETREFTHDRSA